MIRLKISTFFLLLWKLMEMNYVLDLKLILKDNKSQTTVYNKTNRYPLTFLSQFLSPFTLYFRNTDRFYFKITQNLLNHQYSNKSKQWKAYSIGRGHKFKRYLHYKTTASQNVLSDAQVKNFFYFIEKLSLVHKIFKFLYF